jgi:thioredoxin-related protein
MNSKIRLILFVICAFMQISVFSQRSVDSVYYRPLDTDDGVAEEVSLGSFMQKDKHTLVLFGDLTCMHCEFKDKVYLKDAIAKIKALEKKYPDKLNVLFLHYFDEGIREHISVTEITELLQKNKINWKWGISDFGLFRNFKINSCPDFILFNEKKEKVLTGNINDIEKQLNKK